MKKNILLIIVFVVIAIALIWAGVWYNNQSAQQAQTQEVQTQAAIASTTMQGLQITDLTVGTGTVAENGDTVTVNYTGTLDNGTVFDSSLNPGRTPFSFLLGASQVIQGWDLGVVGMKVGGTRELVIAPSLGYGAQANGPIPANSTLHFKIQLLAVTSTPPTQ